MEDPSPPQIMSRKDETSLDNLDPSEMIDTSYETESLEGKESIETVISDVAILSPRSLPKIADEASKVKTHFEILSIPTRKGQARYRCIKCSHEFECTGRNRLIQHIIGTPGKNRKNVKICPDPHVPMKLNLLKSNQIQEEMKAEQTKTLLGKRILEGNNNSTILTDFHSSVVSSTDEESSTVTLSSANTSPNLTPDKSRSPVSLLLSSSAFHQLPSYQSSQINNEGRKRQRLSLSSTSSPSLEILPEQYRNLERMTSIINNIHNISPQVLKIAILMENLNDFPTINPLIETFHQATENLNKEKKTSLNPFILPLLLDKKF